MQLSTIAGRVRRPDGRVIKPTHMSQTDFIYYKRKFANKEQKTKDLSLMEQVTLRYISKCEDDKLLSSIAGINLFSQFLRPLIQPKDAPAKSKWLSGSVSILYVLIPYNSTFTIFTLMICIEQVIDAYVQIIMDVQSETPRAQGTAFLETDAHCQQWKMNGENKGTTSKRYRQQRADSAIKYFDHEMVT